MCILNKVLYCYRAALVRWWSVGLSASVLRGKVASGLSVSLYVILATLPDLNKGPRTQNTLHRARSLPSTMHADPESLVSPETRLWVSWGNVT
jgi:hypothetical protein